MLRVADVKGNRKCPPFGEGVDADVMFSRQLRSRVLAWTKGAERAQSNYLHAKAGSNVGEWGQNNTVGTSVRDCEAAKLFVFGASRNTDWWTIIHGVYGRATRKPRRTA